MKASSLNSATARQFLDRAMKIESASRRQWGKLEPEALLEHLTRSIEISLGEHKGADVSNFFTRTRFFRWLFIETLPWPKGKLKAPDYFTPPAVGDIDEERKRLTAAVTRFVAAHAADPSRMECSPLMGPLTLDSWSTLHGLHFDHHFRQFGV